MCPNLPASASAAFPSDPYRADGLSVSGAEAYSAAPRRLTIWGGTITSISAPRHAGSTSGNSTAEVTVRFRATNTAVLLAWGGHLAQSRYWDTARGGARDGASMVSGAPWHMRTLNLDGGGARNQDRSIQPSAVVGELPPFALAPSPPPTPTPPSAVRTPPPGGGDPTPRAPRTTGATPTVPPTTTLPIERSDPSLVASVIVLVSLLASSALTIAVTRRPRR
jgi:hypothetical protein